jgi:hypothetical protein
MEAAGCLKMPGLEKVSFSWLSVIHSSNCCCCYCIFNGNTTSTSVSPGISVPSFKPG